MRHYWYLILTNATIFTFETKGEMQQFTSRIDANTWIWRMGYAKHLENGMVT